MSNDQQLELRLSEMLDAKRDRAGEPMPRIVEERVLARLRDETNRLHSQPRWWLLFATGLVTAAVVAFMVQTTVRSSASVGVVARVGDVSITPKVDDVRTSRRGHALLKLPLAHASVLANTRASLSEVTPKRVHVALASGSLVAEVEPNHPERTFSVTLAHAEVVVTGTVFYVATSDGHSQVAVERGHVEVRRIASNGAVSGEPVSVSAGELIDVGMSGVIRRGLEPGERAAMLASLRPATWQSTEVEALAQGLAISEPPSEALPSFEPEPAPAPAPPSSPIRSSGHRPRSGKQESVKEEAPRAQTLLAQRDCQGARAALESRQDRSEDASRAWFEMAQCFSAAGDVPSALASYREVVRRFPAAVVSENAAYEVARLSRELHRNDDAEAAFADYVTRYPKGALAQEAYFWRCHMAATNGHIDTALSCLRAFRERFPKSARVNESYFSEATLLRTSKHDCRAAMEAYQRYLQAPGEHAEQAEQWRAWCEARLR